MDGSFDISVEPQRPPLKAAINRILEIQRPDGAIAWFENGPWDPWNHIESAMALTAVGHVQAASQAFDFLAQNQRPDGAWLGEYGNALPMVDDDYISREPAPAVLDSNFCAYPAVGLAHYYLATGDPDQTQAWWPMVARALNFVCSLQRSDGSISWSAEAVGTKEDDALLAGNASIAKSFEAGIFLAEQLGREAQTLRDARAKLVDALRHHPERFDRRGTGSRFAMDWYYPLLAGIFDPDVAKSRLSNGWETFVMPGIGCRCVSDEPWVTVAETCELIMAALALERRDLALDLYRDIQFARTPDNGPFWMGWQTEEAVIWPKEQPSWTQAAVILAADALFGTSPASQLLISSLPIDVAANEGS